MFDPPPPRAKAGLTAKTIRELMAINSEAAGSDGRILELRIMQMTAP